MSSFIYNHGDEVKDKITGWFGIITCRADYITGCNTYGVQPGMKADGTIPDPRYIDEDRIEMISPAKIKLNRPMHKPPGGGPAPTASRSAPTAR